MSAPPADRILVVEDDPRIRAEVAAALESQGFGVEAVEGLAAARAAMEAQPALVVLDLGLPDGDGIDLCRGLREAGDATPIVILTARDANEERIRGLDAGADDYVIKPFDMEVLLARLRSVLRRARGHAGTRKLQCGAMWLDAGARTAGRGETA